jgi:hypothetical protein
MPTNDILPFGLDGGANVMTQADYLALTARTTGFQPGIARSEQLNKVWRQSAFIAQMIAQFIVDEAEVDVRDDGDSATMLAHFITAVQAAATSGGGFNLHDWLSKNANYTAYSKDRILCDVSAAAFTIECPATPTALATEFWVAGNFATHNLTLDGNGELFDLGTFGTSATVTLNKDNLIAHVLYDGAHWRVGSGV